jgi:hypothetical protein
MPTTCPEFEAIIAPYIMKQRCGIAIIRPLGDQIVAYWGPEAKWGSSPLNMHTGTVRGGVNIFMHHTAMAMLGDSKKMECAYYCADLNSFASPRFTGPIEICEEAKHLKPHVAPDTAGLD